MKSRMLIVVGATVTFMAVGVQADPPARVGRLNLIKGTVSVRPAGVEDWTPAELNRIVTTGDGLWTDESSRAEVHVGSTALRFGPQTAFDFVNVDDETLQGSLAQGRMSLRIRHLGEGQAYEVDTPNGAISLTGEGHYRIEVGGDGNQSKLFVWSGGAEVMAAGSSFQVHERQLATLTGTEPPSFDLEDVGADDDWDHWCAERDRRDEGARSLRYVSDEMPGYEDLDEAGSWAVDAEYGNVWYPSHVPHGWAPYHMGHWGWTGPWGWSWIDDAPWGFAPFHYGRWAHVGSRWAWSPVAVGLRIVTRPVFAPALVAFVGGPHWNVGVPGGAVAWVPLGPGEVFRPGYAVSERYLRNVNITNVTNVTNITNVAPITGLKNFRNFNVNGAVMAAPLAAIAGGRPLVPLALPLSPRQLLGAPPPLFLPPVVPLKEALLGGGLRGGILGHIPAPPPLLLNRSVIAKLAPPPLPVPFRHQHNLLAVNSGKPLSSLQQTQLLHSAPGLPPIGRGGFKPASVGGGLTPKRANLASATTVAPLPGTGFVQPGSHVTATTGHLPVGSGPTSSSHLTSTTGHQPTSPGPTPMPHFTSSTGHLPAGSGPASSSHVTSTTGHPPLGSGPTTMSHATPSTAHLPAGSGAGPVSHATSLTGHQTTSSSSASHATPPPKPPAPKPTPKH